MELRSSSRVYTLPEQCFKGVYISAVADFEVATWKEVGDVLVDASHIYILGVFGASGLSISLPAV